MPAGEPKANERVDDSTPTVVATPDKARLAPSRHVKIGKRGSRYEMTGPPRLGELNDCLVHIAEKCGQW